MNRPRIPVVFALGIGIVLATMGALARRGVPPWASFSRAADGDQRNAVAKPEVRDAAEERLEHEDGNDPPHGPAIAAADAPRAAPAATFFQAPAAPLDAGRRHGRDRFIRGPPGPG